MKRRSFIQTAVASVVAATTNWLNAADDLKSFWDHKADKARDDESSENTSESSTSSGGSVLPYYDGSFWTEEAWAEHLNSEDPNANWHKTAWGWENRKQP